jgi:hypothetical protein
VNIGVIIDHNSVTRWQALALMDASPGNRVIVYNCTNSRSRIRWLRHPAYYALNLMTLRNNWTRRQALPSAIAIHATRNFECITRGSWQLLPTALLHQISSDQVGVIVKFGMGLLRVPDTADLSAPILSYHHGDPRVFRGRPAGFYELLFKCDTVGQIVQILTNTIDSGAVVAFAETKVHRHSYRATMVDAFKTSPYLLKPAIANAHKGGDRSIAAGGKNYRLPSNIRVLKFLLQLAGAFARRLAYGAVYEKNWRVAEATIPSGDVTRLIRHFPESSTWRPIPAPPGCRFIADPFYYPDGDGVLVEGLISSDELGAILHLRDSVPEVILKLPGHVSYPATLSQDGADYLVPETCEWRPPRVYRLRGSRVDDLGPLNVPGHPRLVDPTLHQTGGTTFLFANIPEEGDSILRLWTGDHVRGQFTEHPASPIRISPNGGRMAGAVIQTTTRRFRIGQDLRTGYGNGVSLFEITALSPTEYTEELVGSMRLRSHHGPHTINVSKDQFVFDYYEKHLSFLAGVRRLRHRLANRQAQRPQRSI